MKRIAVDIDGVLANLTEPFLEFYNKEFNDNFKIENLHTFDFKEVFEINIEEERRLFLNFFESDFFKKVLPVEGAQEIISFLSNYNKLSIITARDNLLLDETIDWLDRFFSGKFEEIHFAKNNYMGEGPFPDKSTLCSKHNFEVIIEDDLHYATQCAEKGIMVILINYPWNQEKNLHPKITRVNDWKEVLEHLK